MKIIIISGPTASGKSSLALSLADFCDIEIINADALQIYEGLPILSAQPNLFEKQKVPHHLYSHFKPDESCSVGLWLHLVKSKADEIISRNKIPVIVGGTGMYISKLIDGIAEIPDIDESLKTEVRELAENLGRDEFIKKLVLLGEDFEKIQSLDKQRLIRVYEVISQTKKSIYWWQNQPHKFIFDPKVFLHVNLNLQREKLYENCNKRFDHMAVSGAVDEVKALIEQGVKYNCQITKTLGFEEIKNFLAGRISQEEMILQAQQKTRNYAKRQLTWFRNQFKDIAVFDDLIKAKEFLRKNNDEI